MKKHIILHAHVYTGHKKFSTQFLNVISMVILIFEFNEKTILESMSFKLIFFIIVLIYKITPH